MREQYGYIVGSVTGTVGVLSQQNPDAQKCSRLTVAENGGDEKLLTNELPTVTNNHGLPTPALDLPGCYMTKSMVVVESWGRHCIRHTRHYNQRGPIQ